MELDTLETKKQNFKNFIFFLYNILFQSKFKLIQHKIKFFRLLCKNIFISNIKYAKRLKVIILYKKITFLYF